MIKYFNFNVLSLLLSTGGTNPQIYNFLPYYMYYPNIYYSGIVWYPESHLQLSFLIGPTVFSVLFSYLFGKNISLSLNNARGTGTGTVLSILQLFLAAGGCCIAPLWLAIVSLFEFPLFKLSQSLYSFQNEFAIPLETLLAVCMILITVNRRKRGCNGC
jgi:hypothetical protein